MSERLGAVVLLAALAAGARGAGPESTPRLETPHLLVQLDASSGGFTVLDKRAGVRWVPPAGWRAAGPFQDLRVGPGEPPTTLHVRLPVRAGRRPPLTLRVRLRLDADAPDLHVALSAPGDAPFRSLRYPPPLVPASGPGSLAFAPYCSGLLLPLRVDEMPRRWWSLDLPFFGVTNVVKGWGYACMFATPDDARLTLHTLGKARDAEMAACPTWLPSLRTWRYDREVLYRFRPAGGVVALAKAYRAHAKATGLVKTLREKAKAKPAVARLLGAPDVWGADGLRFCQEAKAAGITHLLVNGSWGREATEAIKSLGYLVSVYDNYEDMMPGKPGRMGDCTGPEQSPLMANGKRMLGWPVHVRDPETGRTKIDPETGKPVVKEQWLKRCTALQLAVAKRWIPKDQAAHPRNARFLDVTTACGLRECFDPAHPCSRTQDRKHREALARYVGEELGLVLGGEHGRWYGAPIYDYWEGMQSGGFYSWPAGHVGMDLPRSREEIGQNYLTYGIGHVHRIPLWQLVFGDCTVDYWYWGDSTGHLYDVAPEITTKKDLFNILYASLPLYWVNRPFGLNWSKPELRQRLLESYRVTCKLHEQIGFEEMLTHEWLTPDRAVQRTTFSGGTAVLVNFGDQVYEHTHDGKAVPVAPLGFFAAGPTVLQYRIRKDGRDVTYVKTPDYLFGDAGGEQHDFGAVATSAQVTVRAVARNRLLVHLSRPGTRADLLRPSRMVPGWELPTTHVLKLDMRGRRTAQAPWGQPPRGAISLAGHDRFEIVCAKEHDLPNPRVGGIRFRPEHPRQGDRLTIEVALAESSKNAIVSVPVALYLDPPSPGNLLHRRTVLVEGTRGSVVAFVVATDGLDGRRAFAVVVDPDDQLPEIIETDNVATKTVFIQPDPSLWRHRLKVEAANGEAPQEDAPVVLRVDFAAELGRLGVKGTLDPQSIRVCERRADGSVGKAMPCQFDPAPDFDAKANPKGEVAWIAEGPLARDEKRPYWLLFDLVENGRKIRSGGIVWHAATKTAETERYRAVFREGRIAELSSKAGSGHSESFLAGLVYSSEQTGWVREEDGQMLAIDVLANGPVRAVVRVEKRLKAGLVYTKTYTFWPDRFDAAFEGNKAYGVISRAYYALPGTYEDSAGNTARIDGKGDGEGVIGQCPKPKWYTVRGDGWAHSCVALSPFQNIVYWDAPHALGGVGFTGGDIRGCRMSCVLHGPQKDAGFGQRDYERLTNPPIARIVE